MAFNESIEVVHPKKSEIVIWSVFPIELLPKSKFGHKQINVFFTGENIRPPLDNYDLGLSFDLLKEKNHFRLPLWWLYCDWTLDQKSTHLEDNRLNPYLFHKSRDLDLSSSQRAISAYIGNMTPNRRDFLTLIESNLEVRGFGGAFNAPIKSKLERFGKEKFTLCFENSIWPGYHTEKLPQAWALGAVPVYSGASSVHNEFNSSAFLNLADYSKPKDVIRILLEMNDDEILQIVNQPLLKKPVTISPLIDFWKNSL